MTTDQTEDLVTALREALRETCPESLTEIHVPTLATHLRDRLGLDEAFHRGYEAGFHEAKRLGLGGEVVAWVVEFEATEGGSTRRVIYESDDARAAAGESVQSMHRCGYVRARAAPLHEGESVWAFDNVALEDTGNIVSPTAADPFDCEACRGYPDGDDGECGGCGRMIADPEPTAAERGEGEALSSALKEAARREDVMVRYLMGALSKVARMVEDCVPAYEVRAFVNEMLTDARDRTPLAHLPDGNWEEYEYLMYRISVQNGSGGTDEEHERAMVAWEKVTGSGPDRFGDPVEIRFRWEDGEDVFEWSEHGYITTLPGHTEPDMDAVIHLPETQGEKGSGGPIWITVLDAAMLPDVEEVFIGDRTPPTSEGGEERGEGTRIYPTGAGTVFDSWEEAEHAYLHDPVMHAFVEKVSRMKVDRLRPSSEGSGGEGPDWPHGVDAWLDEIRVILNRGESLSKADQKVLYRLAVAGRRLSINEF